MFASSYDTNPNQMNTTPLFSGQIPKKLPATFEPRKKKLVLSNESWLGIRDPYDGLLIYPHITGKDFIPNKSRKQPGAHFSSLICLLFDHLKPWNFENDFLVGWFQPQSQKYYCSQIGSFHQGSG